MTTKIRETTRRLLERLETAGALESVGFDVPGLKMARRAGFVESHRVGVPSIRPLPGSLRRRRDFRKLGWRHALTAAGRAAVAELAR